MGVLKNPRWEIVAQEIAKGATQTDAYAKAYQKAKRSTCRDASTALIRNHPEVMERVTEILRRKADNDVQASKAALAELKFTKQDVLRAAVENLEMALTRRTVKAKRGRTILVKVNKVVEGEFGPYTECKRTKIGGLQPILVDDTVIILKDVEVYERDGPTASKMVELLGREHGMFIETKRIIDDPLDVVPEDKVKDVLDIINQAIAKQEAEEKAK